MTEETPNPAEENSRRRGTTAVAALIIAPLILIAIGFLLGTELNRSEDLRAAVNRSYETRLTVQRLLSLHQDIETGQRGYVVSGQEQFLAPYEAAKREIGPTFDLLAKTTILPSEVDALRRVSQAQQAFAGRMVELRRGGRQAEAMQQIAAGRGKRIMDRIRLHIARTQAAERRTLETRTRNAEMAQTRSKYLTFVLLALLVALLAVASIANRRIARLRAEAARRAEEQRARLEAIFNSAKDGILTLNASGSIETINPAAASMFGYDQHDLIRRDIAVLFEVAPDVGDAKTFIQRMKSPAGAVGRVRESRGKRQDGSVFPCEAATSPVQLPDGVRYVVILRDVTERKQVEQMKSEFVSTVSHELRTPLTSIAGSLGLLAGGAAGALPDKAGRLVTIARDNSERLVRLINDILDIEKIESGKMRFVITELDVAPLVDQAVQEQRGFATQQGVEVAMDPIDPEARIFADSDRMLQVLGNLLSNAIKFSPQGRAVRVSVTPLDRRHRITIADQGAGIPEDFRPRIFGKFAQADSTDTRQKGGTGLGLSIVKEIVTRLGGNVSFESGAGEGTAFHVDIPAAGWAVDAEPSWSDPEPDGSEPSILHVEDDPDMLRVVASALEGRAQVSCTPSVEEARAIIQRHRFDAIVLDIGMADGSGLELIPLLRRTQPGAPIILFTAQETSEEIAASADAVVVKSRSSLDVLAGTIERLLEGRAQT